MNGIKKTLQWLLLELLVQDYAAASNTNVPKGFEELAQGQTLWLEVMMYGHSLGLYQASVDLDNVQFLLPDELTTAVRKQINASPEQNLLLSTKIGSALKRNGQLACSTNGQASGCDYLETDSAAIIYDENNAQVQLFLGSQFHQIKPEQENYYQVTTQSRNALVHQQNVNFITDENYQSATVQGNGALGVTENSFLNVDWNWQGQQYRSNRRQRADVNNAYYRYDLFKSHYVQGGIMDSRDIFSSAGGNINLSQLPIDRIRGARIGSTLAWLNQDSLQRGTPVVVFLSQDARVDAYRDSLLLASFYLNAGTHELDTRSLPAGSYTVTLRIFENNQLARIQTVPFTNIGAVKSKQLQWFLQGGVLDNRTYINSSDDSNPQVIQGGARLPLAHNLSLTAGTALLNEAQYYESAFDWRHGFNAGLVNGVMASRFSYLYGTDGSSGNTQQLNYSDGFSLSFYRTQRAAPDCNSLVQTRYSYSGCYNSTTMMFSLPIKQWSANLSYTQASTHGRYLYRSQLPVDDPDHTAGAPWEQIFVTRSRSRIWQAGVSRVFLAGGVNINTSINAFTRSDTGFNKDDYGGFFTVSVSRISSRADSPARSNATLGTRWQTSRQGGDQFGYNASYSRYVNESNDSEIGASFSGINTDSATISGWGTSSGRYGSGSLNLTNVWENHNNRNIFSAGGSYASSLLIDRTGVAFGRWGDGTPSSAVTVALETQEENSTAEVSISLDTGSYAELEGKGQSMLTVPGYRSATLSVVESARASSSNAGSDVARGAGSQQLFMTPGRVWNHNVEAKSRYTWLGKLTNEQQHPIDAVAALNAAHWIPLSNGGFMMETLRPIKTLYLMQEKAYLQCSLEIKATKDVVRHVGTTECQPINLADLPDAERQQAELLLGNSINEQALETTSEDT